MWNLSVSSEDIPPSEALYRDVVWDERGEVGSSRVTISGAAASSGDVRWVSGRRASARVNPSPEPLLGLASAALQSSRLGDDGSRSPVM